MSRAMEMIERVRAGEYAEDVVQGSRDGKDEKDDSGGLRERTERFLKNTRKK